MQGTYVRYAYFYTGFVFKRLFGTEANKDLLISFLNALLQEQDVITDLTYLKPEDLGTDESERKAILDVYCETDRGEKIWVEIQKGELDYFKDKTDFYSTFPIHEPAERGSWYNNIKAAYAIGILNFTFDDSDPEYFHREVKLLNAKNNQFFNNKLTYIYLETPKFNKTEDELTTLFDKWLYAIRNISTLMERPAVLHENVFVRLFEATEITRFDYQERKGYEYSLKIYRDMYSVMETAKWKGHAEGLAKVRAERFAKGYEIGDAEEYEKGREEGQMKKAFEIARNMKHGGISTEIIQSMTGLSPEEIETLD